MGTLRLHKADVRRALDAAKTLGLDALELELQEASGTLARIVVNNGEALAALAPAGEPIREPVAGAFPRLLEGTRGRGAVEVDYRALLDGLERAINLARKPPRFAGRRGSPVEVTILAGGSTLYLDRIRLTALETGDGEFFSLEPVRVNAERLLGLADTVWGWLAHDLFRLQIREGEGSGGRYLLIYPASWRGEEGDPRLGFLAIAEIR